MQFEIEYTDRLAKKFTINKTAHLPKLFLFEDQDYYENNGLRKAICLTRYVSVVSQWIYDERYETDKSKVNLISMVSQSKAKDDKYQNVIPISLREGYRKIFELLRDYLVKEQTAIDEPKLTKEIEILQKILDTNCTQT